MGIFDYKGKWHPHKDQHPSVKQETAQEAKTAAAAAAADHTKTSTSSPSSDNSNLVTVYVLVGVLACFAGIGFVRMRKSHEPIGTVAAPGTPKELEAGTKGGDSREVTQGLTPRADLAML